MVTFRSIVIVVLISVIGLAYSTSSITQQEVETGHYNFALNFNKKLYEALESNKDYVLHSPVNVYAAMAVVAYASDGNTKEELTDLLGLPTSYKRDVVHKLLANTFKKAQTNKNANMTMVEGIFLQDGFDIKGKFKEFVENVYKARILNVDFLNAGEQALRIINRWVSDHTEGRIKQVSNAPYNPDTVVLLANALYFHARWKNMFDKRLTSIGKFYNDGRITQVKFMRGIDHLQYYEDGDSKFRAIGIPYEDNEFSIYYVLPDEDTTLKSVINKFDKDHILQLINAKTSRIDCKIPQMELQYEAELNEHLKALGVQELFTDDANLENLAHGIKVSKVIHKVELKVNEEGTVGSAATTTSIANSAGDFNRPKEFIVNRPFLFFVHHRDTNMVIFLGSVRKPPAIKSS